MTVPHTEIAVRKLSDYLYYSDNSGVLYLGDALDVLRGMPDESVQCCVTSPPYWGLRDYGTAQWEGGDSNCDHLSDRCKYETNFEGSKQSTNRGTKNRDIIRSGKCPKCGAIRIDKQLGLEKTPEEYVEKMVEIFREVRRVLRNDGTCWLNLGDSYAGSLKEKGCNHFTEKQSSNAGSFTDPMPVPDNIKPKDLVGIPWRVAFALQSDGWHLRSDIIWSKPNPMPESVTDRPAKSHEYIFLLTKSPKYFYDAEAVKKPVAESTVGRGAVDFGGKKGREYNPQEGDPNFRNGSEQWGRTFDYTESCANGRNKRTVWTIATAPFKDAHFAVFPPKLIEPCIKAGTPEHGCCAKCGAPWVRITKASGGCIGKSWHSHNEDSVRGNRIEIKEARVGQGYKKETLGWKPTCKCDAGLDKSIVLDPFMGSGTTAMVAKELGRRYIGIDLKAEYLDMSKKRLAQEMLL